MSPKFGSEKKRIEQITPEQTMALRTITGILLNLEKSTPKVVPIKIEKPIDLNNFLTKVETEEKVKNVEPENILKLTRAERPISFDVAVLTRVNAEDESSIRQDIELGKESELREDESEGESDHEFEESEGEE